MVRLASQGSCVARAGGRAALLCACAIAALAAPPAAAAPVDSAREDIAFVGTANRNGSFSGGGGATLQRSINGAPSAGPVVGHAGPTLTANRGTFDVQVDAPARPSHDMALRAGLSARIGNALNGSSISSARIEQMLIIGRAPPAADQVHVDKGVIVLTSSSAAVPVKSATVAAARRPPPTNPPNNGTGSGNGTGNGNNGSPPPPPPPPPDQIVVIRGTQKTVEVVGNGGK